MRGKKQKIHIPAAGFTDSTAGCLKYAGFHAKTGSTDSISKSGWREIFRRVEVWKVQAYFVYVKLFEPMDRRKSPVIRRR
jgi:D-aminopeptidase